MYAKVPTVPSRPRAVADFRFSQITNATHILSNLDEQKQNQQEHYIRRRFCASRYLSLFLFVKHTMATRTPLPLQQALHTLLSAHIYQLFWQRPERSRFSQFFNSLIGMTISLSPHLCGTIDVRLGTWNCGLFCLLIIFRDCVYGL